MKPYHHFLCMALLFVTACNKPCLPEKSFKAKLVASFCGHLIVQIEDGQAGVSGMDWTDPAGKQYQNVFTVKNVCSFLNEGLNTGDRFIALIIEAPQEENCALCDGFMETPPLKWNIKVVE